MKLYSAVTNCLLAVTLLASPAIANTDDAFQDFQNTCLAFTDGVPTGAFADVQRASDKDTNAFNAAMGADDEWVLWLSTSPEFALSTYGDSPDFCQVWGIQIDYAEFRSSLDTWLNGLSPEFVPSDMKALNNKGRGGVAVVKLLGDKGVQQITINYRPDQHGGFVSMISIRLDEISPMARKILNSAAK